jgi:hypothetical protein
MSKPVPSLDGKGGLGGVHLVKNPKLSRSGNGLLPRVIGARQRWLDSCREDNSSRGYTIQNHSLRPSRLVTTQVESNSLLIHIGINISIRLEKALGSTSMMMIFSQNVVAIFRYVFFPAFW